MKTIGHENSPLISGLDEGEGIVFMLEGFELLSPAQQRGIYDMLQGAINVMVKHKDAPKRGDVGWRKQSLECHLSHAADHSTAACVACNVNDDDYTEDGDSRIYDDGLPHIDHATARVALYYAKRNMLKKEGE